MANDEQPSGDGAGAGRRNPRVLLNATTINKGGGIQAVVSFIRTLVEGRHLDDGLSWVLAVSPQVRDELAGFGHALRDGIDRCLAQSPARSLGSRRALRAFAAANADLVFTFFGPAYVRFPCPHVCGVADPWVTHSTRLAYSRLAGVAAKARAASLSLYKALWFRRAQAWIVEEQAARAGLITRLRLPADRIHVVANNCAQAYVDAADGGTARALHDPVRILTFAADYPHKCLDFLPDVAAQLIGIHGIGNVEFVVTVPQAAFATSAVRRRAVQLGIERHVVNEGFVPLRDGPALYRRCDIVLMPTVLETFSATYPEAMAMGLPIVTSDLGFARSVCGEAALYFAPLDAADAATKLAALIDSPAAREALAAAGYRRARQFPLPEEKYRQIRTALENALARSAGTVR